MTNLLRSFVVLFPDGCCWSLWEMSYSLPIWKSGCRSQPLHEFLSTCLSAGGFQTPGSCHSLLWLQLPSLCQKSVKKRYGHPGMKSMNNVLKCSGRQGNMAHPLWMHCCHGLSCPCYCWAGPGKWQDLHSISRSWAAGTCFCSEQVGEQLPYTAAHHVLAPLPRLLCSFFIARSFCLAALLPALKIGLPGAKDELCKWKQ